MKDPRAYWSRNVRLVALLLVVWFAVSFGLAILLAEPMNRLRWPGTGFKLGFWMAQQGSIFVFVGLIWIYVVRMNRLDREHGVSEDQDADEQGIEGAESADEEHRP